MAAAIADLEAGRIPTAPQQAAGADKYRPATVFAHYHKQRYELLTSADPERAVAVKADYDNHIASFLAAGNITDIRDIDYDVVVNFSAHLAGKPVTVHARSAGTDVEVEPPTWALRQGTARNVIDVLANMLDSAVKRGLIDRNSAHKMETTRPIKSRLRPRPRRPRGMETRRLPHHRR